MTTTTLRICCMNKCYSKQVSLKNGKYFCDTHIDARKCVHCLCYFTMALERGKCDNKIFCNKCYTKYELVGFEYYVCCYKIGDACLAPQTINSIFCTMHKGIKLCSHCDRYRTDGDVAEYRELKGTLFCGQCIEKISETGLIQSGKDPEVERKIEKNHDKRRRSILAVQKYKKRKADEEDYDSEASESDEVDEFECLNSEIDHRAEKEAHESEYDHLCL